MGGTKPHAGTTNLEERGATVGTRGSYAQKSKEGRDDVSMSPRKGLGAGQAQKRIQDRGGPPHPIMKEGRNVREIVCHPSNEVSIGAQAVQDVGEAKEKKRKKKKDFHSGSPNGGCQ